MESLVANIIREKTPCFFISPHLDDAVLSAGGLIHQLAGRVRVKVLTVFTAASMPPYSRFARNALRNAGYADMARYYRVRRAEDRAVMGKLGVEYIYMGFVEAAQRKLANIDALRRRIGMFVPEVLHNYPSGHHIFSGRLNNTDSELVRKIKDKLLTELRLEERKVVFCPVGVGMHVDHVLLRDICSQMPWDIVYWDDFPYNIDAKFKAKIPTQFIKKNSLAMYKQDVDISQKGDLIKAYQSQLNSLFGGKGVRLINEGFYYKSG